MIRARVPGRTKSYPVRVEPGLLDRAGRLLRAAEPGTRVALLVTDRTVGALYGDRVARSLERSGFRVIRTTLPVGERAKSFDGYRRVCERWTRARAGTDALVVALGGGVVSDVAGFAAATYARGLRWAALPTTIVAQADAAIGGKVGINLAAAKNLVGAFHHPVAVLADPAALATLPAREVRAGVAEVLKIGVIARPGILSRLERVAGRGPRARLPRLAEITPLIRASAAEKVRLVGRDERDQGPRRALNFGHTVGHAIEAATGYRRYLHGEAVSIGMVAALRLSVLEAGLDPVDASRVESLLGRLGLPTHLEREPDPAFWSALQRDKKRGRSGLRMVLCPAIGSFKVFELPSLTTLRRVVRSLVRRNGGGNP